MNSDKIKKWQKILKGQIDEMTDILERRFIFQQIKKIVENNSSINQDNIFYDYFRINYIYAQIIQLSRMLDQDLRTESVVNLLEDIENNPEVFDRNWRDEISKIVTTPRNLPTNFKNFSDEEKKRISQNLQQENQTIKSLRGKTLTLELISENRCNLLCRFAPIKKYRDRQIAHKQIGGQAPNLTFEKLDQFIDFIHERILVYADFLGSHHEGGLMPIIQYDWQSIFKVPWIK